MARELERVAKESKLDCPNGAEVVLLATDDIALAGHLAFAMLHFNGGPLPWHTLRVLSVAPHDHQVTLVDEHTLELTVLSEHRKPGFWESVYRRDPFRSGQDMQAGTMRVHVMEASEGGWTRARFRWENSLTSDQTCFVKWNGKLVVPMTLPAVGASDEIPRLPGPMSPEQ